MTSTNQTEEYDKKSYEKINSDFISPRDIKMTEAGGSPVLQSVITNAEISATANEEAKRKREIWAGSIETESLVILESMKGNFELWNSIFRNELMKRDCLDLIKYEDDQNDKTSFISNKKKRCF